MKYVLGILGIALAFIALSLLLKPAKNLDPYPQDTAYQKFERNQKLDAERTKAGSGIAATAALAFNPKRDGVKTLTMKIKEKGDITIELYAAEAPQTVKRFVELATTGYFNGILFHRVVPGFVAQAGDPTSKNFKPSDLAGKSEDEITKMGLGKAGSGQTIVFEKNDLQHQPGTLSMALSAPKSDTGDSQFFIDLADNSSLNGDYCVFGKVIKGMEVVKKLGHGDLIESMVVVPDVSKK